MAKNGCTVFVIQFESDYEKWKDVYSNKGKYNIEKKRILNETLCALEDQFTGIIKQVEATDVATPVTCERYTGNWCGSTQGWVLTTEWMTKAFAGFRLPKTFNDVNNFYLIGQWTEIGGGLAPAIRNGRDVVKIIKAKTARKNIRQKFQSKENPMNKILMLVLLLFTLPIFSCPSDSTLQSSIGTDRAFQFNI